MLSPQSTADPHIFYKSLSAGIYKFIACMLHNTSFVSITKRKLRECCQIAIQYIAKFCVLLFNSAELVLQTFVEKSWKQNEIRAFRLHYFCTILYVS